MADKDSGELPPLPPEALHEGGAAAAVDSAVVVPAAAAAVAARVGTNSACVVKESIRVVVRFRPQQDRERANGGVPICQFEPSGKVSHCIDTHITHENNTSFMLSVCIYLRRR